MAQCTTEASRRAANSAHETHYQRYQQLQAVQRRFLIAANMLALYHPCFVASTPAKRLPFRNSRISKQIAYAGSFDESAAQVRRLVDRDRKELDFDALEDSFKPDLPNSGEKAADQPSSSTTESTRGMQTIPTDKADKTPVSPFGPSSSSAASPFSSSAGFGSTSSFGKKPFAEPSGLRPDMPPADIKQEPWWTKITLTQIVIVLSFTTIIALMLATFYVVFSMGAVKFNDA